jgi:hypothetical protein
MTSLWSLVNTRALSVEIAQGAFSFEISWLGIPADDRRHAAVAPSPALTR